MRLLILCALAVSALRPLVADGVEPDRDVRGVLASRGGRADALDGPSAFERAHEWETARDERERALCGSAPFVIDHVIVQMADDTEVGTARLLLESPRYRVASSLFPLAGIFLVEITDGTRVPDAILELSAWPWVRVAAPDHLVRSRATVPSDALFGDQWNLANMGQFGGTPGADIGATTAWDRGTGSAAFAVAIIDGGVAINHPDLAPNRWLNVHEAFGVQGVDDDGNGYVDDRFGWDVFGNDGVLPTDAHGSHVSGIVGARGDNGIGVSGVNWHVSLVHVAAAGSTSTAVAGYAYVAKLRQDFIDTAGAKGANIVATNTSFGIDLADCASPAFSVWNSVYDALGALGILSAAATTNEDVDVDQLGDVPTSCTSPYLVTVTSTDRRDELDGGGHGANSIDVGAPGDDVRSCNATNGYLTLSGTSMAAPHVAGAIAWLHSVASQEFVDAFAADPGNAALALKSVLLAEVDIAPDLVGQVASNGRLDLARAGDAMAVLDLPDPSVSLTLTGVAPAVLEAVRIDAPTQIVVTGSGFLGLTKVELDGVALASFPPQYEVVSDNQLRIGIENVGKLGVLPIVLTNSSASSVATSITIVPNTALRVDLVASEPTFMLQAYGVRCHVGAPLSTYTYLVFSFSPSPSILPGLVALDLGNNFFDVIVPWSGAMDPATGEYYFHTAPLGQFALGTKLYVQAASIDLVSPSFPLIVSNRQTGTFLF